MNFHSARAKLDRAKHHIAEVEAIISALPNVYTATVENNPSTGNEVLKHDLPDRDKIIDDLALIFGDAIHNLHCALDHAWVSVLTQLCPANISGQAKFPIRQTRDQVKAALRGIKIDSAVPTLFGHIVETIQPYEGGNDSIWVIHILDIDDKHRLLLPMIEFASIQGIEVENERGEVEERGTWGTHEKPPYYIEIAPGWHFKKKGKVSFSVLFDEGQIFQFADIRDMLSMYSIRVFETVQSLENFVLAELALVK